MKKIILSLLAFLVTLVWILPHPVSAETGSLMLSADPQETSIGETVHLSIRLTTGASDGALLNTLQGELRYDAQAFTYQGFLLQNEETREQSVAGDAVWAVNGETAGTVRFGFANAYGGSGDGYLLTVLLRAEQAGIFELSVHDLQYSLIRSGIVSTYTGNDAVLTTVTIPEPEVPTESPEPTATPTAEPTEAPTTEPTESPTTALTTEPTDSPTTAPTSEPTDSPTTAPTTEPTEAPTAEPTEAPTTEPTAEPTDTPSPEPTDTATPNPTATATPNPTATPEETERPSSTPTEKPTRKPTPSPTRRPTATPTLRPTATPTPTFTPTPTPTVVPTPEPTSIPTAVPSPTGRIGKPVQDGTGGCSSCSNSSLGIVLLDIGIAFLAIQMIIVVLIIYRKRRKHP